MALFRALPSTPIYSVSRNRFELAAPNGVESDRGPIDGLLLLTQTSLVLGRESSDRRALLIWARMRASGRSIQGNCWQDAGIARKTLYRRRDRASAKIALALNLLHSNNELELLPLAGDTGTSTQIPWARSISGDHDAA